MDPKRPVGCHQVDQHIDCGIPEGEEKVAEK